MSDKQQKRSRKGVGGRPSNYDPKTTPEQAYKLCLLGATDKELADFFGVSEQTLNTWKSRHPEFLESIKRGKDEFDTERVEKALVHRAIGYSHPEDDIRVVNGEIVITPTVKHYPPDTTAIMFWLRNRRRDRWRDKFELDHGVQPDNPLADLLAHVAGHTLRPTQGEGDG